MIVEVNDERRSLSCDGFVPISLGQFYSLKMVTYYKRSEHAKAVHSRTVPGLRRVSMSERAHLPPLHFWLNPTHFLAFTHLTLEGRA